MGDEHFHTLLTNKLNLASDGGDSFKLRGRRWDDYCELSQLSTKAAGHQMTIFRACLSDDMLKILLNRDQDDEKKDIPEDVIKALCLNMWRERYQLPTPHEAIPDIASIKGKFFTKFDVLSGYWQCLLDLESRLWQRLLLHHMDAICPSAPHSEYRQYLSIIIVIWRKPLTHTTDQTHHRRFHCLRQRVRGPHKPCLRDSNMLWREGHTSQYSEICLRVTGNEILGICAIPVRISDWPPNHSSNQWLSTTI